MGIRGVKGSRGVQGDAVQVNWKQCVWDRSDTKDTGVIQVGILSDMLYLEGPGLIAASCIICVALSV